MTAIWITNQVVFNGATSGLLIGLIAVSVVLVYRVTRVVNFAAGNIGAVGGSLMPLLVLNYRFPYWLAFGLSLLVGILFSAICELTVIRRLFKSPRIIVLIATVGLAQLATAIARSFPRIEANGQNYPSPSGKIWENSFWGIRITSVQMFTIIFVPMLILGLMLFLKRTTYGKTIEASASNSSLARISGVNPKFISTFVWALSGLVSTIAVILLSAQTGGAAGVSSIGQLTIARTLLVFLFAGMHSYPRTIIFGILLGIAEGLVRFNFLSEVGLSDLCIFLLIMILISRSRNSFNEQEYFRFAPRVQPLPRKIFDIRWFALLPKFSAALIICAFLLLPIVVSKPSSHLLFASIACFGICAMSLTVITGWLGQVSLSQMSFAGIGALLTATLSRGIEFDIWILDYNGPPVPFALSIVIATLFVATLTMLIGIGTLKTSGTRLAILTFTFAVAAQQFVYRQKFFSQGNPSSVRLKRGEIFGINIDSQRSYYYLCIVVLITVYVLLSHLRQSGFGRSTIAVRDNPTVAASYTVSPDRIKRIAFSLAGGLAALGGGLIAGLLKNVPLKEQYFTVSDSLTLVGMIIIGGLGTLSGPIIGAFWIVGVPALFPGNELVPLLTSSLGLLIIVMYFPGGFSQIGFLIRNYFGEWVLRRRPEEVKELEAKESVESLLKSRDREADRQRDSKVGVVALRVQDLHVRFDDLVIVPGVSFEIGASEIVGLIGTNGAGKSTIMNAIGGFIPSRGGIELFGEPLSGLSIGERARLGLGRTFQTALLFPELTVYQTIQVALASREQSGFISSALSLPRARKIERRNRSEADEIVSFLQLGQYVDTLTMDLSTGTRRIVELANLLAVNAKMFCLDEPTAGLAQRETEAYGPFLVSICQELRASALIVEHDMPLVMAMSDRILCLETGNIIAEGTPAYIRNNPQVIASYLGTDERAIGRSNQS